MNASEKTINGKMSTEIINTLRNFYSVYGVKDEGPSSNTNVNDFSFLKKDLTSELSFLEVITNQSTIKKDFTICNNLIEELAEKLSNRAHLIEELEFIKDQLNIDVDGITNGIIWFQQAQTTGSRNNKNVITKESEIIDIDPLIISGIKDQGSLILQLYIALVYMRSGPVADIFKIGSINRCQVINVFKKLFNSDYIRHIRNSLSHGTFKINIAGVYFKDEKYELVATPGFLEKVCIWIFVFYHQCVLFARDQFNK